MADYSGKFVDGNGLEQFGKEIKKYMKDNLGGTGGSGSNGRGIASITKTATSGLIDTYTITYTDNTTSKYTVTNGASVVTATVNSDGELVITLTDDTQINAGKVIPTITVTDNPDGTVDLIIS